VVVALVLVSIDSCYFKLMHTFGGRKGKVVYSTQGALSVADNQYVYILICSREKDTFPTSSIPNPCIEREILFSWEVGCPVYVYVCLTTFQMICYFFHALLLLLQPPPRYISSVSSELGKFCKCIRAERERALVVVLERRKPREKASKNEY
jgi:hypothetical protein